MEVILTIIGIWGGTGIALLLFALATAMRHPAVIKFVSVIGWFLAAFTLVNAIIMISLWIKEREGLAPLWGMLGVALLVLMATCVGVGKIQERQYDIPWGQAFAAAMLEAGLAIGASTFLHLNQDRFAEFLCLIRPGLGQQEAWNLIFGMLWKLDLALAGTLLSLEFVTPFLLPARDRS